MRKLLALLIVLMMMGFSSICHAHEDMQDWAKELLHTGRKDLRAVAKLPPGDWPALMQTN